MESSRKKVKFTFIDEREREPGIENLLLAAELEGVIQMTQLLNNGMDPNSHKEDLVTPLHIASQHNNLPIVQLLLKQRTIQINLKTKFGNTAIHLAAICNHIKIVELLLKYNADVNICNINGHYPLHSAVIFKCNVIVKMLIEAGAYINVENVFGKTPLYSAVIEAPNIENMQTLIEHGADMDVNNGITMPIIVEGALICTNMRIKEILATFIEFGCDINIQDRSTGRTAMHMVALTGFLPLAKTLVIFGALYEVKDYQKKTPLNIAQTHGNYGIVRFIQYLKVSHERETHSSIVAFR